MKIKHFVLLTLITILMSVLVVAGQYTLTTSLKTDQYLTKQVTDGKAVNPTDAATKLLDEAIVQKEAQIQAELYATQQGELLMQYAACRDDPQKIQSCIDALKGVSGTK